MSDTDELHGETALVTGASAGIGRATAHELADRGAAVVLVARSEGDLEGLAGTLESEYGVDALACPTDVSDHEQVDSLFEAVEATFGTVDIVVNNAGVGQSTATEDLSVEEYRSIMGVNVDGVFFVTRASIPLLRESAGHLVFVGSTAGQHPEPDHPVYAATKWWVRGLAQNLSGSLGDDDVAVTTVNPTAVRTEFGSEFRDPNREVFEEGAVLEPADVAEAIAFAASRDLPTTVHELDLVRRNEFSGVDRFES